MTGEQVKILAHLIDHRLQEIRNELAGVRRLLFAIIMVISVGLGVEIAAVIGG